jgi:dTDP-4-dehydrorhamnose 3,5-epimerase-like enzyme
MILQPVLDHYRAVNQPDAPFVPRRPPSYGVGIGDVLVTATAWRVDPRGALGELYREAFDGSCEQAYVSITRPDSVKGWHLHCTPSGHDRAMTRDAMRAIQTDRFVLLRGRLRLGLVDLRGYGGDGTAASGNVCHPTRYTAATGLPSAEIELDSALGCLRVDIPPGVAHGWIALGGEDAHVLNLVSREYDGTQERRCDPHGPVAPGLPAWDWRARRDG